MADVMTPDQRSRCMSRIKRRDTKPEIALRRALWGQGLRYRVNSKLPGRPDILFVKAKIAVFVDGCFWHGCPEHGAKPKSNAEFWEDKLGKNRERDHRVTNELRGKGYTVLRFWEHEIAEDLTGVVRKVREVLD